MSYTLFPGKIKETRAEIYKALYDFFREEIDRCKKWNGGAAGDHYVKDLRRFLYEINTTMFQLNNSMKMASHLKGLDFPKEIIRIGGHE